uniref:MULE transposase domain-containing protein n=1 Tax=Setaria italica TaxID=4555 RepID=K3Z0P2_SETIT
MRKYGCRVDEMILRGRFDCGKSRPHYVVMNLASESNWKQYKEVVEHANVVCLELVVEIFRMPGTNLVVEIFRMPGTNVTLRDEVQLVNHNGTQESEILQHGLGERQYDFSLAIANDDFPIDTFEQEETNIDDDDDDISLSFEDGDFEEDEHVWSRLIRNTGQWRISKIVQPHTYRSSQPKGVHIQCTTKYLGRRILGIIRADSETSVPSLVESIFTFIGYHVKYSKAWWVKQHAVAPLWGDWKESYGMVHRVLTAMAYYNPRVKWFTHSTGMMQLNNGVLKHVLQRVFWCFLQCRVSFQHCRPVILVDGTFLTGKYKGALMMAVAVHPEQQLVPLAFALAKSENNDNWSWFMKLVRGHVFGPSRQVCMISDRHHDLLHCANDHMEGFPLLVHRWCTRHFAANMWRRQKNKEVIGKLKNLCMVHTEKEFYEKLEDLGGMRWGIMITNYSESLNDIFKGIQSIPVSGIIEYSFEKCNAYFVDRWQKTRDLLNEDHRNGKVADEHISEAKLRSINQLPEPYRTKNACKARGLNYESPMYMSPLCSREHTIRIWKSSFEPYLDPSQWPPYEGLKYVPNSNLKRNKIGRRQKKRLRGDMDESQGRLLVDYGTGDFDVDTSENRCSKMADPVYPLLEAAYDMQHRSHLPADLHGELKPLRPRVHSPLRWDERYTHTFHLPCSRMTVTMQDVAMILGLPLEGLPVMRIIQSENWYDMVELHIGIRPLELEEGENSKKTSGIDRKKRYKENDGRVKHAEYLQWWDNRPRCDPDDGPYWCAGPHKEYLRWYYAATRTRIKSSWTIEPIKNPSSDFSDDIVDEYDTMTRLGTQPERAPLHDYMQLARLANEASVVMEHASGSGDGVLRSLQRYKHNLVSIDPQGLKKLQANGHEDELHVGPDVHHADNGQGTCSGSRHTPIHHGRGGISRTPSLTTSRIASASTAPGSSSRSRGKAPTTLEASEESEDDDPTYGEHLEMSDMFDAPPVTQTQGESSQADSPVSPSSILNC